ncbi:MAG: AbrB/MazE/SpoVT family DNA-binding domain-containing protein [Anaerolineaceae bacterium]|nr:AbrB/MazE/SpoVT family DNA-binding domain-containing protein [Anaerolineaceae bacterium]
METAKIFMNGRSQAIRLPKEFRFEGDEVYIKKVGDVVMLIPYHAPWRVMADSLEMFSEDFMSSRAQPELQEREDLFT